MLVVASRFRVSRGRESPVSNSHSPDETLFREGEVRRDRLRVAKHTVGTIAPRAASISQRNKMACQTKNRVTSVGLIAIFDSVRFVVSADSGSVAELANAARCIDRADTGTTRGCNEGKIWSEGKPAPVGLDGLEAYRRKVEERGENEEKTRSGSRVLEERKKRIRGETTVVGGEGTGKIDGKRKENEKQTTARRRHV